MEKEFFTVGEAAKELASNFTEEDVMDLVAQERLYICIKYTGEIIGINFTIPQGDEPDPPKTIRFRGILKLMQRPTDDGQIKGWGLLVSVLRADGITFRFGEQYRLPTQNSHGGYLKPGYKVVGFVHDAEVPRAKWLFHIDDLTQLNQGTKAAHAVADTQSKATAVKIAPFGKVPVSEARHTGTSPRFTMTKAALIEQYQHEWSTIVGDIAGAKRNGLSAAAKAGERQWREADAIEWARTKGRLQSKEKPANLLQSAMHNMSKLPAHHHKLKG